MLRTEQRRHERRQIARTRFLAIATTLALSLGIAVGGSTVAMANPNATLNAPIVNAGGVTTYNQNGLVCDGAAIAFTKPGALDGNNLDSDGTYTAAWGSISWDVSERTVTWTIVPGWDVDVCVKGGTYLSTIDTSVSSTTSYTHTYAGLSHLGFRIKASQPTNALDCDVATNYPGRALTNGDHINIDITQNGATFQINAQIDIRQSQDPVSESGLVVRVNAPGGPYTLPISNQQKNSGTFSFAYATYLSDTFTVEWVQFNSTYFNQNRDVTKFLVCGELPTDSLVTPTADSAQLGCDTAGSYTLDDVFVEGERAVQWYVFVGDEKPADLSGYAPVDPSLYGTPITVNSEQIVHVRAEAIAPDFGIEPDAPNEFTFTFTAPEDCPPPPCIPDEFISYTYIASGSDANTGVVTVAQPAGYGADLCRPLYVTAAAWSFDVVDNIWAQTLVAANRINGGEAITTAGTYPYGAAVGCGQGDIYASRTAFPEPSPLLLGPNQPAWPEGVTPWPFSEVFLHSMGFTGPTPTYMVTNPGCNAVEPAAPVVEVIEECGTVGSLTITTSPFISYIVRDAEGEIVETVVFDETVENVVVGGAQSGVFTITPVAAFPYILEGYDPDDAQWTADLGEIQLCPEPVTNASIGFIAATCELGQQLDPTTFVVDDAELARYAPELSTLAGPDYAVVFVITDENAVFFDSDSPPAGRTVSDGGKTLTFTGTLLGPDRDDCEVLPIIDPFDYVDTCAEQTFTLFFVEGLTYWVTINGGEPFAAVFAPDADSTTYTVNEGDFVSVAPSADAGNILGPDQPTPLERQFAEYGPDDCQLPELANWPASATATNQVCTPLGLTGGSITVQLSTGPEGNATPVRYYLAYGTAQQRELTTAVTAVAPGSYVVTAVASVTTDSINDSGNTAVFPVTVGAAADQECDLPTLAFTGATSALAGAGAASLLLMLLGFGALALRRQRV